MSYQHTHTDTTVAVSITPPKDRLHGEEEHHTHSSPRPPLFPPSNPLFPPHDHRQDLPCIPPSIIVLAQRRGYERCWLLAAGCCAILLAVNLADLGPCVTHFP
ncbi:uncharacterized protein BO72DRAFT_63858 [Aspergillus fijiensis CBS 313.89]|uniref:Uncharacterized protein n=1 Tax=Aspergillus fijiensis CBS 313.89 TaxID=1448319 RepID=A0A8G1RSL9_9EURO|nr:uncharacterized protein BO72DRAFT_63858 [Aspergillus fijiensis CBS 313.89]RAK78564.1 hypothetical protein BO72DRAFT_63858 [Aspergillus fijiensis CBS 313.89]